MKCVVTGAAGFIGSSLSDELIRRGHEVVGIDCFVDYYPRAMKERNLIALKSNPAFCFVEGNLTRLDLPNLLAGAEWVFHQAAQAGVRASWGKTFESYTELNVLATQCLLEACKSVATLKKVVYASSSSVYGNAESYPTSEDATPAPVSPYGVTKLAAEHLMCLYASEFSVPTTSLRYFTVYGPRQRPDMAFHRFARAALTKEPLTIYGDGKQIRDFTFISDIVNANIAAAEKGKSGGVYNLGGGSQISVNGVLDILRSLVGDISVNYFERQKGDAFRTCAATERAQNDLGFSPHVDVPAGLKAEVEWLANELAAAR